MRTFPLLQITFVFVFWLAVLSSGSGQMLQPDLPPSSFFPPGIFPSTPSANVVVSRPDVNGPGTITLSGTMRNGCVPYAISHTAMENRLNLEVLYPGPNSVCTQAFTDWSLSEEFGPETGPEFSVYVNYIPVDFNGGIGGSEFMPGISFPIFNVSFGDVDLDGTVNSGDLGKLLNNFEKEGVFAWKDGDFTNDNAVTSADLGKLLNNIESVAQAASSNVVPEPDPIVWLFAIPLFFAARYRYRATNDVP